MNIPVPPIRAIVVDDEPLARRGLMLRLARLDGIDVIAECANGSQALGAVAEHMPDLLFLDIQMPGMSGFDVISRLQQDNMPMIVFVTAYDEYAVAAFEVRAMDYLLKPIDDERLADSVERAKALQAGQGAAANKQQLLDLIIGITGKSAQSVSQMLRDHTGGQSHQSRLAIRDGAETTLLKIPDIDWIDAAGDYMCIHANDETHIMRTTMKELESRLDPATFQRVHRSTIVNLSRVEKVISHINGEYYLLLAGGQSVKMSRSYRDKVDHFR
jgi:two-component system LytT family response regulator